MLQSRNYNKNVINAAFEKLKTLNRLEVLERVIKPKVKRVVLAIRYHPKLPCIPNIIKKHWNTMTKDQELKKVFPKPPMVAFKQPPNLRSMLIRANLPPTARPKRIHHGLKRCTHSCPICIFVNKDPVIKSTKTGEKITVQKEFTCATQGVIYITTCTRCKKQYIGQSKRRLVDRIKEHSSNIRYKKETTTALHYNSNGHTLDNLRVQVIERVVPSTPEMLLEREHYWIQRLQTKLPHGLNTLD